jgi:hypothetical protein
MEVKTLYPYSCRFHGFKRTNAMYSGQNYLNQNKFAFLCCEKAERKLSGSWCHHIIFMFVNEKRERICLITGERAKCVCFQVENEMKCIFSTWDLILITRLEKSRKQPPIPTQAPLLLFYLLLKQMKPIVGNFCAALNASIVTLTEINAFNLPLWYIRDAIQQPVGSSLPCKLLCDETHSGRLCINLFYRTGWA